MDNEKLRELFAAGKDKRVLVIGDLFLDEDYYTESISFPIVRRRPPEYCGDIAQRPGAAGYVAVGLKEFGFDVELIGWTGDDEAGERVIELLSAQGIHTDNAIQCSGFDTMVHRKILAGVEPGCTDKRGIVPFSLPTPTTEKIESYFGLYAFHQIIAAIDSNKPDAIVLIDQVGTVLTPLVRNKLLKHLAKHATDIEIIADSKTSITEFVGANMACIAQDSLIAATPAASIHLDAVASGSIHLFKVANIKRSIITCGTRGIYGFDSSCARDKRGVYYLLENTTPLAVSGAGEIAIVRATAGMLARWGLGDICALVNLDVGVAISKAGM